jgi:hypothetical protein
MIITIETDKAEIDHWKTGMWIQCHNAKIVQDPSVITGTCQWKRRYINWAINPHTQIAYGPKHKFEFCPHCQKKIEVAL